ncbi:adenosine deaminase [Kiloniella laminariae]|uniref:Adenosine deaminase n=1 Tax=Kiloniella laminariae TaxID=454162 RepID=A0ABT4LQT5_9PROT|nr:adenosine deaminase [Kiloniella laminariae]MCZ4282676.1 adenosine deaminase [Kiloniella laminariae]
MVLKAEIHSHLEGTASPALVRKLASRHGMTLPDNLFTSDDNFRWTTFLEFLKAYDMASAVIRVPEDYRDVTYDYLKRCAAEDTLYVEVMSSPDHAAMAGMTYQDHLEGITRGITDATNDFGIEARIIVTCVRHLGPAQAEKVALQAVANPHPLVVGFGMGGDENAHHPSDFAKAFHIADEAGLQCNVHAGEMAGPESVIAALDHLPVKRIGHGVRSIEDPDLVKRLIDEEITLEVCPGSNIALGVFTSFNEHSFLKLQAAGVKVTLNSDDAPYFATSIGKEYLIAREHFKLSDDELLQLTRTSIENSFADQKTKLKLLARVQSA